MARVFMTLTSRAKTRATAKSINVLESHSIPYEKIGRTIYLISERAYASQVDVSSRDYDRPYSKFCMQLSDSTAGGSIGMGEAPLDDKTMSALYKVFGDSLSFEFTLSCNDDVENKTARIIYDARKRAYVFETLIDEESAHEQETYYIRCDRCGNLNPLDASCECARIATKIVDPPSRFKKDIDEIRRVCRMIEKENIPYGDWVEFFVSKGYKATSNLNLTVSLGKTSVMITNKANPLPLEINFIEGMFAGWLEPAPQTRKSTPSAR